MPTALKNSALGTLKNLELLQFSVQGSLSLRPPLWNQNGPPSHPSSSTLQWQQAPSHQPGFNLYRSLNPSHLRINSTTPLKFLPLGYLGISLLLVVLRSPHCHILHATDTPPSPVPMGHQHTSNSSSMEQLQLWCLHQLMCSNNDISPCPSSQHDSMNSSQAPSVQCYGPTSTSQRLVAVSTPMVKLPLQTPPHCCLLPPRPHPPPTCLAVDQ